MLLKRYAHLKKVFDRLSKDAKRFRRVDCRPKVGSVLETLGVPRRERAQLIDDPSIVRHRACLVDPLAQQQIYIVKEKATPILQRDEPWRTAGGEIVCLREDPRISQNAAPDENAVHSRFHLCNDLLGLDAVAA